MREYFTKLLGNERLRLRIGQSIDDGTLPHALLLVGPDGSGKMTFATEIAAALNCERKSSAQILPCGECSACRRIYEGNFPDVNIAQKPSDRATLGVDTVKTLREDMFLSATESKYKVYIIKGAECMTPEAQNALLKVLEEPPAGVFIMLLASESDKVLTTIKSRSQYLAMSRFTEDELARILPRMSDDARRLEREDRERFLGIIMSADGTLGKAMLLSAKKSADECRAQRDEVMRILNSLESGSNAEIYLSTTALGSAKRQEILFSLENVISALRDLTCVSTSPDVRLLFFTSRNEARSLADKLGLARIMGAYDATVEAHGYCSRNANTGNLLTNLASRLIRIAKN